MVSLDMPVAISDSCRGGGRGFQGDEKSDPGGTGRRYYRGGSFAIRFSRSRGGNCALFGARLPTILRPMRESAELMVAAGARRRSWVSKAAAGILVTQCST